MECRHSTFSTAAPAATGSRPGCPLWMRPCLAALQEPGPLHQPLTRPGCRTVTDRQEWAQDHRSSLWSRETVSLLPPGAAPQTSHQGRKTNTGNMVGVRSCTKDGFLGLFSCDKNTLCTSNLGQKGCVVVHSCCYKKLQQWGLGPAGHMHACSTAHCLPFLRSPEHPTPSLTLWTHTCGA